MMDSSTLAGTLLPHPEWQIPLLILLIALIIGWVIWKKKQV